MKPYKTLLILLVFMVFLYGPSLFYKDNIKLPGNIEIGIPQINDLIPSLTEEQEHSNDINKPLPDSLAEALAPSGGAKLKDSLSLLPLIISDSTQIRILYYGDSQLEGDRITDRLRILLRNSYGGSGPGLLSPTMISPYTRTAYVRSSSNWEKIDLLSDEYLRPVDNAFGPRFSLSRFTVDGDKPSKAWIKISPSSSADSLAAHYESLRLFYGNLKDTIKVSLWEGRRLITEGILEPEKALTEALFNLDAPETLEIRFEGKESPDLYGFSIESSTGLILDNIALRGSSGTNFRSVDRDNLQESLELLDPDLIVLHFGLNIVLNIRDDYSFYERRMYNQLMHLKSISPSSKLLLLGVSDMAREDSLGIHSYPNLEAIISAQKHAAERAGVKFWDLRVAMGGEDAIVRWRAENPPLAANDYTHISYAGGHKLAELMYQDLFAHTLDKIDTIAEKSKKLAEVPTTPSMTKGSGHPSFENEGKRLIFTSEILTFNPEKPLIFTTAAFWIFLLALLLIYSIIAGKPLIRNTYLFLFSLFFYYKSGGAFFILLIISTLTDYTVGLLLSFSVKKGIRKLLVFASLLVNLGMLAYYKYTFFITGAINDIAGTSIPEQNWLAILANRITGSSFDASSIILPIGISFFTFQTISYTLDVYRGRTKAVKNILDFGFYVSFFPQLIAGPIVRASEFIPQLYQKFELNKREWSHALFLIVSGLIKKIIVSDYIATNLVDKVFANPGIFSGLENLLAVYGYGLQIYCDFSGYTDIAIGVALMLGFRLPANFNSPYKAVNISDFWRRWHISLSRWLKDYLYISLGGNRKGRTRTGINLLITMLLGGLWHGAAWRFIIWGGLHGAGLMLHKFWSRVSPFRKKSGKAGRFIGIFITFNFVSFCWIFFRAENMDSVSIMLERIASGFKGIDALAFVRMYYGVLVVMLGGYVLHFLPARIKESYRGLFILTPLVLKLVIVYIIALALYNFQTTDIQPFIYFRF